MAKGAIARARAAGYWALVVTIDTPVAGLRERDFRNGTKELLHVTPGIRDLHEDRFASTNGAARSAPG